MGVTGAEATGEADELRIRQARARKAEHTIPSYFAVAAGTFNNEGSPRVCCSFPAPRVVGLFFNAVELRTPQTRDEVLQRYFAPRLELS